MDLLVFTSQHHETSDMNNHCCVIGTVLEQLKDCLKVLEMFLQIHYSQFCNHLAFVAKQLCLQMKMDQLCEKNFCLNLSKFDVGQMVTKDMANKRFPYLSLSLTQMSSAVLNILFRCGVSFFVLVSHGQCSKVFFFYVGKEICHPISVNQVCRTFVGWQQRQLKRGTQIEKQVVVGGSQALI